MLSFEKRFLLHHFHIKYVAVLFFAVGSMTAITAHHAGNNQQAQYGTITVISASLIWLSVDVVTYAIKKAGRTPIPAEMIQEIWANNIAWALVTLVASIAGYAKITSIQPNNTSIGALVLSIFLAQFFMDTKRSTSQGTVNTIYLCIIYAQQIVVAIIWMYLYYFTL